MTDPAKPAGEAGRDWDARYSSGEWDRLDSITEMARYMVVVGYLACGPPDPRILDLGCGHGRLLSLLGRYSFTEYFGVDISHVAIERARALSVPRSRFEVRDIQEWVPNSVFDAVVLNESLYYARHPRLLFERALGRLSPGGIIVVSMFRQDPRALGVWRQLEDSGTELLGGTAVTDYASGYEWDVKAMSRPR